MPSLLTAAGLKNFSGSVNLVFDTQGQTGLLLASGSVDQTGTYVFEVAPRGVMKSAGKNLSYWSTTNGDDTMVTIWNPADEAQTFIFRLIFAGGHYDDVMTLGPGATKMFDVSEVIANSGPDPEGNVIAADVREGSAKILGLEAENQHILLAVDSGVYNVRKATCFGTCTTCDGATSFSVVLNPFGLAVNAQTQESLIAPWNTGAQYDYTSTSSWSSSNTSIATVHTGLVSGVSPGSFTATANFSDVPVFAYYCNPALSCPWGSGGAGGSGTVQVPTADVIESQNFNQARSCPSGYAGWDRDVNKEVVDQNGNVILIPLQSLSETYTIESNQLNISIATGTATTNEAGIYGDEYWFCSTKCPSSEQTDATQHDSDVLPGQATAYTLTPNSIVYACGSITVNGK